MWTCWPRTSNQHPYLDALATLSANADDTYDQAMESIQSLKREHRGIKADFRFWAAYAERASNVQEVEPALFEHTTAKKTMSSAQTSWPPCVLGWLQSKRRQYLPFTI